MAVDEYTGAEKRIEYLTAGLGLAASLITAWHWGWRSGLGIACGSGLSWVNFRWLKGGISTLAGLTSVTDGEQPPRVPRSVYVKFLGRFVLMLVAVYVILTRSLLPSGAVLLGLFAVVGAVMVEMIYELMGGNSAVNGR